MVKYFLCFKKVLKHLMLLISEKIFQNLKQGQLRIRFWILIRYYIRTADGSGSLLKTQKKTVGEPLNIKRDSVAILNKGSNDSLDHPDERVFS